MNLYTKTIEYKKIALQKLSSALCSFYIVRFFNNLYYNVKCSVFYAKLQAQANTAPQATSQTTPAAG